MAGVRIDSPLMSRNIVEIFDIIEGVSRELEVQRKTIGELATLLAQNNKADQRGLGEVFATLKASADYCSRMLG